LPGREDDMVATMRRGHETERLHADAMFTLTRLPKLQPETIAVVRDVLAHSDPKVRSHAIHLLVKHSVIDAQHDVRPLLVDSEADVRKAAIEYFAKTHGLDWEQIVRRALIDEAEPVVFRAMCLLKDAKLLRKSDIETMLGSKDAIVRSRALWAADTVVEGAGQVRISDDHLFDPSKEVRRYAILAATRDNIPSLLRLIQEERDPAIISCILGALAKLGDASVVPAVIEFTSHSDGFVRQDAARALGKLKDPRGVEALRRLLADHSLPTRADENGLTRMTSGESVSKTAREALAAIDHPTSSWLRRWFS
jgi:HEAT repeat protein